MSARAWQPLGAVAPDRLVDARLQLHHAAQIVASVGQTFLEPRPDDGHPNLGWLPLPTALAGHPVPEEPGFQAALEPASPRLLLLGPDGEIADGFAFAGETLASASAWLAATIADRFGRAPSSGLTSPGYELPAHDVAKGAPFTAEPDACAELARWFDAADAVLADRAARTAGASEVRCWPHHFDLATLVTVETGADGSATKTVGIGLSPGDGSYAEPYWYVAPWPYPDASRPLPGLAAGHWHREGFTAAILTGGEFVAAGPAAQQPERLGAFLDSALAASRDVLGR